MEMEPKGIEYGSLAALAVKLTGMMIEPTTGQLTHRAHVYRHYGRSLDNRLYEIRMSQTLLDDFYEDVWEEGENAQDAAGRILARRAANIAWALSDALKPPCVLCGGPPETRKLPYGCLHTYCRRTDLFVTAENCLNTNPDSYPYDTGKGFKPLTREELLAQLAADAPPTTDADAIESAYLENGGSDCPVCGSGNLECGRMEPDGSQASQHCTCLDCCAEWDDLFNLTGMKITERGTRWNGDTP